MNSAKKASSGRPDEDNPEWTRTDIGNARPAAEVLSVHLGAKATDELLRRSRGRPLKKERKVSPTLRIDPDVLGRIGKGQRLADANQ